MDEDAKRSPSMTHEELQKVIAALRSEQLPPQPPLNDVVQRNEARVALGIAALIVTLIFGAGGFFFVQLLDLQKTITDGDEKLRDVISARLDRSDQLNKDDRDRIVQQIIELDKKTRKRIDELNLDAASLSSENQGVNSRLGNIEEVVYKLLDKSLGKQE